MAKKNLVWVTRFFSILLISGMMIGCQNNGLSNADPQNQTAALPITSTPMILPLGDNATPAITMTPVPNSSSDKASSNTGSHQEKIVIMNTDRSITISDPDGQSAHSYTVTGVTAAALSPDGKKVAYNCDKILTHIFYLLDVQTGQSTQISKDTIGGFIDTLRWSPQGDQLAFSGTLGESSVWQIYLIDPISGEIKPLTHFTQSYFLDNTFVAIGSWSADGNTISFSKIVMPAGSGYARNTLQTLNVKTGEIKAILDEDHSGDITRLGGTWLTPDGKTIFFDGKKNGHYHIFRIDVDGSHLNQVTSDEIHYDVTGPMVFSPDGQSFFTYAADQKAGDLNGVPSLFSIDGQLIRQLSDYQGKVGSWNSIVDSSTSGDLSLDITATPVPNQPKNTTTMPNQTPKEVGAVNFTPTPLALNSYHYDGKAIQPGDLLYTVVGDTTTELYAANPQQNFTPERIAILPGQVYQVCVHPDRQGIDYLAGTREVGIDSVSFYRGAQVYTLRFADASPRLLATFPRGPETFVGTELIASWSYDGRYMVFARPIFYPKQSGPYDQIGWIDLTCRDSGNCQPQYLVAPEGVQLRLPLFSPNSYQILLSGNDETHGSHEGDVYLIELGSHGQPGPLINLTHSDQIDEWPPHWLPDGSGFLTACSGSAPPVGSYDLCRYGTTPSLATNVLRLPANMNAIDLSPDGKNVVDQRSTLNDQQETLRLFNLVTRKTTPLKQGINQYWVSQGFSSDSQYLCYQTVTGDHTTIFQLATGKETSIDDPAKPGSLSWLGWAPRI